MCVCVFVFQIASVDFDENVQISSELVANQVDFLWVLLNTTPP